MAFLPGLGPTPGAAAGAVPAKYPDWFHALARFETQRRRATIRQLGNTLVPFALLWALMVVLMNSGAPYGAILLLAIPASLFMVRLFILFHDAVHLSLFPSKRANRIAGTLLGILLYTPYERWGGSHWVHHGTVSNLDRRGTGDVWTMTVEEYRGLPKRQRLLYRLYRNPVVMFLLGPTFSFLLYERFYPQGASRRIRRNVHVTNAGVLAMVLAAGFGFGFRTLALVQLPVLFFAGIVGFWLFYIQHQFQGVYWARNQNWDRLTSALEGSSFYRLPRILQWFAGNIGFHMVHHVRPLIPNYNLPAARESEPALRAVEPISLRESFASLRFRLYDEERKRLVGFRAAKA